MYCCYESRITEKKKQLKKVNRFLNWDVMLPSHCNKMENLKIPSGQFHSAGGLAHIHLGQQQ